MTAPRTLYHCFSARSFRPLWALEEMQLPYNLKVLPFPPRVRDKSFMAINPLGTIPFYVEGTHAMTESAAICEFLGNKHGPTDLSVKPHEDSYGSYLNFLHHGEATLTFPQTLVLRYSKLEPPERRQPGVAEDYARWFLARLRMASARLKEHEYLCADRFTMADISVGYALMLAKAIGIDSRLPPEVVAYWERLEARDGFKRAMEAQIKGAEASGLKPNITG